MLKRLSASATPGKAVDKVVVTMLLFPVALAFKGTKKGLILVKKGVVEASKWRLSVHRAKDDDETYCMGDGYDPYYEEGVPTTREEYDRMYYEREGWSY